MLYSEFHTYMYKLLVEFCREKPHPGLPRKKVAAAQHTQTILKRARQHSRDDGDVFFYMSRALAGFLLLFKTHGLMLFWSILHCM